MEELKTLYQKTGELHHAYLLEGRREEIFPLLENFITEISGLPFASNPDVVVEDWKSLGIKESQALRERQNKKPFAAKQFFIISFDLATPEAQNALLKTFEEPSENTHFFLIVRSKEGLLPTLISRLYSLTFQAAKKEDESGAGLFLTFTPSQRLEFISREFLADSNKRKTLDFLKELEKELRFRIDLRQNSDSLIYVFSQLHEARRFLSSPRASLRLILEHLALIIPKIN